MGIPGGWELVLIVGVVLLLFGGKKIPELAKGLGKGIKDFKQAVNEDDEPVVEKAKEIEAKAEAAVEEVKETVSEATKA
jgi:sec-independent protein translocase protein TatA